MKNNISKSSNKSTEVLQFINKWEKSKENSWSGTPWNLFVGFKEKLNEKSIANCDIKFSIFERIVLKVWNKLCYLLYINDCGIAEHWIMSTHFKKFASQNPASIKFVFTEFYLSKKVSSIYLFIDCSVDFVQRSMSEQAAFAKYLPMQKRGRSWTKKRCNKAVCFYRNCQGIFTMSQWLRNDMIKNSGIDSRKIHAVGGGCNLDISKIDNRQKKGNKFLFIGKEWERKNGSLIIEAFQIIRERFEDMELHIAGVKKPAKTNEILGVVWHGVLNYEDVTKLYNVCDFFVMPSRFEAYGLVFAEALIFGLPCIGADRFAMSEFIQHGQNGYLIKEDTPKELAYFMELMICNREALCTYIKDHHEQYIKHYNWSEVIERMLTVMRKEGNLRE